MKRQFTKTQVLDQFKYTLKVDILAGRISKNDKPAIGMSWNVFTDMLHRDGYITDWQVNNWTNPFYGLSCSSQKLYSTKLCHAIQIQRS